MPSSIMVKTSAYITPHEKFFNVPFATISINQGLFSIQENNNNNIHTFVNMNTERVGNEVILLI